MSTPTSTTAPPGGALTGYGALLRFNLRRDRIRLPVWILGLTAALAGSAASFPSVYATAEDRFGAMLTINNPGTTALIGAIYGGEDYTYGIMAGHQTIAIGTVIAALMSIFTLVRHTRAEEETGRAELVRSSVVGRHASLAAALTVTVGANVVLALTLALSLGSMGIESIAWEGSLLYGATIAAVGLVFTGVSAITAQVSEHARTATSMAGLILALAYALRAIGDVGAEWLSWLSPIGWSQATETYYSNNPAPLGLSLVLSAALIAAAFPLSRRRDVGAGFFGARPGPATAGPMLHGPLGLALHLHRTTLIGWSAALFLFGLMYGPVLSEADVFLEDLPAMADFLPVVGDATGAELFGATIIAVTAILSAVPAVQAVQRLRTEEVAGRAGPLLATPLSRVRWVLNTVVVALVTGVLVLCAVGLGIGLGAGLSVSDLSWVGMSIGGALTYLPAVALTVGVGVALFGWLPRATALVWTPVIFAVVVMYFGGLLDFPSWLINISPFSHIPQLPAAQFEAVPLLWLSVIAVVLALFGLVGIRRRDIHDT